MKVRVETMLGDANIDASQASSQRQLVAVVRAIAEANDRTVPLNLCLMLDRSGSMEGRPLETVKQAAEKIVDLLAPGDRIAIVGFDHRARTIVPNQTLEDPEAIKRSIRQLRAEGGTAIDEGMKLGIEQLAKGRKNTISQGFLLTDGENEHGNNQRCFNCAEIATRYGMTLNTLGFGDRWNQDTLEQIADVAGGTLAYIQRPEDALEEFSRLFARAQSVALTNAYLEVQLMPDVSIANLKPFAQVAPETIELAALPIDGGYAVRLGDLMKDRERAVLANLYVGKRTEGRQAIARARVRYDDPATRQQGMLSEPAEVFCQVLENYVPQPNDLTQQYVLALAKYRQTQIAEAKLQQGDRSGAATLLQAAAKTAVQLGDRSGATVLQTNATQLQAGKQLSEGDRKRTRIVSKTVLQPPEEPSSHRKSE